MNIILLAVLCSRITFYNYIASDDTNSSIDTCYFYCYSSAGDNI